MRASTTWDKYVFALHWALSTTMGEASAPTNTSQRAFVNLVFLIGLLLQASVVGSAASLVLQFDQHRSTFNEQMDRLLGCTPRAIRRNSCAIL